MAAPLSVFVEVPYPPPAAFAEQIPNKPAPNAVWIDGNWVWLGRQYAWQRGGWVVPPPAASFAPWNVRIESSGRLLFAPSGWFTSDGATLAAPPFVTTAAVPTNEITSETQSPR